MTWKKRIISIVLCLCALLCAASVRAEAEDAATTHTDHLVCGGTSGTTCTHAGDKHTSSQTWTAWDGTTTINNDFFGSFTEKYLYLSQDVTPGDYIIVPKGKTLYLCLNGHSLKSKAYYAIYVSGTLVLCDCNGSEQGKGVISHGEEDGSICGAEGIYVIDNAIFTMYGGTISNNDGRGVLVSGGTFTMYGGEISHNTCITKSAAGGGGVWVKDDGSNIGNFTMYGGKICNNEIQSSTFGGGGVCMVGSGSFYMENGTITGNKCNNSGGGLDIRCKTITIKGNSTISGNTCEGEGGGIFIISNETGSITNCTISNNSATGASSKGGGLAFDTATVTITGGSITDNKTAGKGGAMAVGSWGEDSKITLSSGLEFSGNAQGCTADKNGKLIGGTANDVYLNSSAYLRLADDFSKTSTAAIVVTTASEPDAYGGYKKIAEGSASVAKTTDFTYGNDSTIGIIAKTNNGKVELLACKHDYSTKNDVTNHWQECSICGDIKGVTAHSGGKASCTAQAVCQVCHKPYGGLAAHVYDTTKWVKIDTGHHGHKCKNCNAIDASTKAPHSWDNVEVTTPATCTTPGEKTFTCTACSATKTEPVPATGHTYNQTKVEDKYLVSAATCTDKAVYYKSCVCGEKGTATFEYGNSLGHDFSVRQYGENDHWMKCSRCDATDTKEAHSGGTASCTAKAKCSVCGQEYGGLKAHDFANGPYRYDGQQHWKKCANCDATNTKVDHSGGTASCTEKAKCEVCGQEHGEKLAHSYTVLVYNETQHWYKCANCDAIDAKAAHSGGTASCTKKAECSVCGQEYGGLKAHDFENGPYQYDGQQHWKKCADCDATDTKVNHSGGTASCTEKAKCEVCGQEYGDLKAHDFANGPYQYDGEQHWYKCANCTATTEPVAHTDFTAWKSDRSGHWHECSTCGYKTAVTAHTPDRDKATETEAKVCKDCDWVIAPATHPDHTWVFVAETPATCNATGVKEHYKCDCRRKSVTDGVYDIVSDTELMLAINPANHTGAPDSKWHSDSANHWQEYTCCYARANEAAHSGGAATCTAQAVCQVCGKAYGPLAAHDWGAWKVTTPATKDAPGVETRTCAHNSAHTETRSIPKLSTTVYTVSEDTKIAQIEAKVDGLDKILESDENKALVKDGKSVGVSLTVKNTASSGVSEKIKEKLAGSNLVGLRLELTVEKTVTANGVVEPKQTIHDAGVLLKTTITLPAELQGKSGYVVYRLHDGNVHVLTETANENGEFISVSADKTQITICARLYSEYVIAYQAGGSSGGGYHPVNPTPVKATSANTGDAGVLLYGVTAALSLTGTAWLGAKSREH